MRVFSELAVPRPHLERIRGVTESETASIVRRTESAPVRTNGLMSGQKAMTVPTHFALPPCGKMA